MRCNRWIAGLIAVVALVVAAASGGRAADAPRRAGSTGPTGCGRATTSTSQRSGTRTCTTA